MVNSHTEKVLGSSPSLINRLKSFFLYIFFASIRDLGWMGEFWYKDIVLFFVGWGVLKREKIGVG
jgi:hypothetical protein